MENKSYGYYLPDESLRKHVEQRTRQTMGEDAYADAIKAGRGLDVSDIVVFALDPSS